MNSNNSREQFLPIKDKPSDINIRSVLFDFDGTISTFRRGWEQVMIPLMEELLTGGAGSDPKVSEEVRKYIDESTGIQTIHQMKWLADKVKERFPGKDPDMWDYKEVYNQRLMDMIRTRIRSVESGEINPDKYIVPGAADFLRYLNRSGYSLYLASGSDHPDVVHEAEVLGVATFFTKIAGAPVGEVACSKQAVMEEIIENERKSESSVLIIGDGKVEIALGIEYGMYTLGLATVEDGSSGRAGSFNLDKKKRLINAGAHAISADFAPMTTITEWYSL
jgi:phosphoglycolate phosphatase-like HAD superfamily hydrolase